jgi:hypothetical protein
MHPMFVTLYLENDADEVLAEEENGHRTATPSPRARTRLTTTRTAADRHRRSAR